MSEQSFKLTISYDGTHYSGSQYQINNNTIESCIRIALSRTIKSYNNLVFSGRTDSGVHATAQVVSIKTDVNISCVQLKIALNNSLPNDIEVKLVETINADFNARKSAISREYMYLFTNETVPLYLSPYIVHVPFEIDLEEINHLLNYFLGEHDFRQFRKTGSNEKSTIRHVLKCEVFEEENLNLYNSTNHIKLFRLHIVADSFLYRMVRNIVGVMFKVMKEKKYQEHLIETLTNDKKLFQYIAADAKGLSLTKVNY